MIRSGAVVMVPYARNLRMHSHPSQHHLEYHIASMTSTLITMLRNAIVILIARRGSNMILWVCLKADLCTL
jgi:hypothetical protein